MKKPSKCEECHEPLKGKGGAVKIKDTVMYLCPECHRRQRANLYIFNKLLCPKN